jgi:mono/diheme cytochrome c family protein
LLFIPKAILPFSLSLAVVAAMAVPASAQTSAAAKQEAVHAGQQVFTQHCFQCHSVIPDQVRFGPSLHGVVSKPHPRKTDAQVRTILKNGQGKMPSFNGVLSKEDTDNLLAYLHSL